MGRPQLEGILWPTASGAAGRGGKGGLNESRHCGLVVLLSNNLRAGSTVAL
jgi:hypothetical protein